MTHNWEHQWQNVGPRMFWCAKCGALQAKGDPTMYHPVGGGWIESPVDCVVSEDGPDDEPCQCEECVAERSRTI
jgi:hypothetical protein